MLRNCVIFNFCFLIFFNTHAADFNEKAWIQKALLGEIGLEEICKWYGETPLNLAIWSFDKYEDEVFKLLEKGAEVNVAGPITETPLIRATFCTMELLKTLLFLGADPNMACDRTHYLSPFKIEQTAFYFAAMEGRTDMVDVLIEFHADITFEKYNKYLLHHLCLRERIAMLEFLRSRGVKNNIPKNEWAQYTPQVQEALKKMKKSKYSFSPK